MGRFRGTGAILCAMVMAGCLATTGSRTQALTLSQETVVAGTLHWAPFKVPAHRPELDHDHCVFCGVELRLPGGAKRNPPVNTDGYTTADGSLWVCNTCFDRLNPKYRWSSK